MHRALMRWTVQSALTQSARYGSNATVATAAAASAASPTPPPPMGKKKLKRLLRQQQQQQQQANNGSESTVPLPAHEPAQSCGSVVTSTDNGSTTSAVQAKRILPTESYSSFSSVTPLRELRAAYKDLPPSTRAGLVAVPSPSIPTENDATPAPPSGGAAHVCRVAGRVVSIRDIGKLVFVTIRSDSDTLQICAYVGEGAFTKATLQALKEKVTTGDIIGATGEVGTTKQGELTLFATDVQVLVPYVCSDLTVIPDQRGHNAVADQELKYRYRFVDMITDPTVATVFRHRHQVIRCLRNFLDQRGFLEVETPVFHTVASGANAQPFTTHHNANDSSLFLRVAPELYLKQCVVGGLDKVYEIGKVFRNEDADRSHNPEFTSCEFYAAYHTYEDLMPMTEALLREMAVAVRGSPTIEVQSCVTGETVLIDLAKPFRRVSARPEIERLTGVVLPQNLDSPHGIAVMGALLLRFNIPLPNVRTASKLFDKLIDHFITDQAVEPVFVCDHPLFMSPLAKESGTHPGVSERFELFINGMEVCNSYSELNDPQEQLRRFEQQLRDKELGDDEAMSLDETFLKSLQTGLPPTAGWGMGIDRVVMLLTGTRSIRDVILFPLLKQDEGSHDTKRRTKTASFFGFNHSMTNFCLSALEAEFVKRGHAGSAKMEHLRSLRRAMAEMNRRQEQVVQDLTQEMAKECQNRPNGGPCSLFCKTLEYVFGASRR